MGGRFQSEWAAGLGRNTHTGRRVQRYRPVLRHRAAPILGHIDRLVIPQGAKVASHRGEIRTDRGLECKTASAFAVGSASEWGEPGTDQVPQQYLVQCAAYMALTDCTTWDLAVLFGNQEFRIYHLARDRELEGLLLEEARKWWRDHVEGDTPPDPRTEAEARMRWPSQRQGVTVEADEALAGDLRRLARIKAEIRDLEAQEGAIRDRLIPRIGDAETVTHHGSTLATFKANKASQRTDWQALVRHHFVVPPRDLVAQFTTTQPGARVLRLSKEL